MNAGGRGRLTRLCLVLGLLSGLLGSGIHVYLPGMSETVVVPIEPLEGEAEPAPAGIPTSFTMVVPTRLSYFWGAGVLLLLTLGLVGLFGVSRSLWWGVAAGALAVTTVLATVNAAAAGNEELSLTAAHVAQMYVGLVAQGLLVAALILRRADIGPRLGVVTAVVVGAYGFDVALMVFAPELELPAWRDVSQVFAYAMPLLLGACFAVALARTLKGPALTTDAGAD